MAPALRKRFSKQELPWLKTRGEPSMRRRERLLQAVTSLLLHRLGDGLRKHAPSLRDRFLRLEGKGRHGEGSNRTSRDGVNVELPVPVGTTIFNAETASSFSTSPLPDSASR